MEERIIARIAELEQAERVAHIELVAIRTTLKELRDLIAPTGPQPEDDQPAPPA